MREEGLARLSDVHIPRNNADYIVMHYLIDALKMAINKYAKGNVLDIGCGNKPYELFFKDKIYSYTGCDVIQSDKNKVDVICEATKLAFADEKFDTVFSTQVIEHVSDPFKMLQEANRVLKNDGLIIVSAPFCWELHEEPYDFYRYSKYGLKAMFEQKGFEVLEITANGGKWAAIFQMNINMVYSTFKTRKWPIRILKGIFINLHFTALLNRFALWADKRFHDELLTLNYVVIARKIKNV
ncbi:class I SAM-dependent methyltransferase [Niastella caeni]|uniref:Class I SAM-dependent methyltransferase n=1 Tax=Niastella caeni TaxID=2569763 RepID=A0A4S8HVN2_9BACT|nr:class I SAM-dependent methyltransferase [Niastella caeni]THU39465.1 class I SAM-dependent methyltransferase [Niastella caeni]